MDAHTADEYERDELYLNEDGTAGFALRDGDELVSVFAYPGAHAGDAIVEKAVVQGARRLDCYDIAGGLPRLYGRHGFKPIARIEWDDAYADPHWDYANMGRPDVVAMAVTDKPPRAVPYVEYDEALALARRAAHA